MVRNWSFFAPLVAVAMIIGCGEEGGTTSGSSNTGGGSSSASSGAGGAGGDASSSSSASGATGGTGGTGGTSSEFPWEDHIGTNGGLASDRLVPHELGTTGAAQGFYEYTPAGYPSGVKWPLLVALHGIGENGNGTTDLPKVLATGIHALLKKAKWPNDRPFVVLMPQHVGGGCPSADEIQSFLAWATQNYEIDPHYVYLTGLSCGAIGAWSYLAANLDSQIAAFVSVAGSGKSAWDSKGCELGKVAIWAFHGDADSTVDVWGTNVPLDGLAACPHPPALESKKTIYPGVTHNSWDMTYSELAGHDIYNWMLGFKKP